MRGKEEEIEQKKVIHYLRILERQGKIVFFFAPINEDSLAFANRKKAFLIEQRNKAMGKRAGVSDLVVILKDKVLFLEMKRKPKILKSGKKSTAGIKVSENQKNFLEHINKSDVCEGYVCYGFDEAKQVIDSHII